MNVDPALFDEMDFQTENKTWKEAIIGRIDEGKVIPIISNSFMNALAFGNHNDLIKTYADKYIKYPFMDQGHDLAQIAQYESVKNTSTVRAKENYLEFLKNVLLNMAKKAPLSSNKLAELEQKYKELTVSGMCKFLEHPNLDSKNPLLLLAALPLPIYLTTSYHSFLEAALEKAHKKPEVEICRWHEDINLLSVFERDKNYKPTSTRPLVYHLHGLDTHPESLVLTEDDHLDFLTNVASRINSKVTAALRLSSLVVLGYHLPAWDFRVLFRGIIKAHRSLLMESVAIQLEKNGQNGDVAIQLAETTEEKVYLEKYLQQQVEFKVEWTDDPGSFIRELYKGWGG